MPRSVRHFNFEEKYIKKYLPLISISMNSSRPILGCQVASSS